MLQNNLTNIPQIVLLRSDKVFVKLLDKLLDVESFGVEEKFDELKEGVRDFYPNTYRLDEIDLSLAQKQVVDSGLDINYNFSFLNTIFKKFLTYNGSSVFAKENKLEEYLVFITKVSPLQLLGYKLANDLSKGSIELNDLFAFVDNYTPLNLKVDKQKKYAENHLHLKGASYSPYNMLKLFTYPTDRKYFKKDFLSKISRINEFSYINNNNYSIGQIVEITKLSIDYIYSSFMEESPQTKEYKETLVKILVSNKPVKSNYRNSIDTITKLSKIFPIFKNSVEDTITKEIVTLYEQNAFDKALLLENILFFYIYKNTDSNELKYFIKLYLHSSNILRSYMVMSQNLGLAHFSEFSGSYLRSVERRNADNVASSIVESGTDYLNAKLDVKTSSSEISEILLDFKYAFESKKKKIDFNFGLSSKKGKEKYIQIQTGDLLPRFLKKRKEVHKEVLALDDFLRNITYKKLDAFSNALKYTNIKAYKQKEKLKNKTLDISSFVVSIDAVGKETHTPPEVFAPYFRFLRVNPKKLKNNIFLNTKIFKHHPKLLMTVHAGEDFNHLVTGMRRVDESVKFFDMQRGDRLGHVLSLGVFPKEWLEGVKDLLLTKGDYFDDLVWLCKKLKTLKNTNLDVARYIQIYEDKVWKLFSEIYPMSKSSFHLNDLYEAWKYRKNCSITYYKRERKETLFDEYSEAVLDKKKPSSEVKELYELYQTNKVVRDNYEKVISIKKSSISKEELKIWQALQDRMINGLSKKGIVIETNPSSNVFVSTMSSYDYHPIFRFYPPKDDMLKNGKKFNKYNQRDGRVGVTINSDDPAIFVTSLQNEYKTIKNVAIKKYKCSDKEAEEWVSDIRKYGITLFKESVNGGN